jgi:putative AlgH/UPF0301 family transcriptional regulator
MDRTMISLVLSCSFMAVAHAFISAARPSFIHHDVAMAGARHKKQSDEESMEDWRAFRARLVKGELTDSSSSTITTTTRWLHEQPVMERGCLLVHHPPSDHSHYGLTDQRQYLYKSVVLIMELTPRATVGLVLNRPTKSTLPDEFLNAPLMYGGDECGIHEEPRSQKVYAMHRLGGNAEDHDEVLSGLYVTSLGHAKSMIDLGLASDKNDVLAFCGFVTWETLDLVEEMDAGEWRTASIDSSTLYQTILASQQPDAHDMWATIMDGIHQGGRNETQTSSTLFDDRMLQEWTVGPN